MLKKALKTAIKGFKKTRNWLVAYANEDEKTEQIEEENLSLKPYLHSIYLKIIAEGEIKRSNYAWGVLQSVNLAKNLGINRVSVIEFGVAGGNGLVELEKIAQQVESILGVGIDVYGFDSGAGLPKPQDYRDLPNLWSEGYFPMEQEKLQKRLTNARLLIGLVEDTIQKFIADKPAPVAFISFDLDLYSSTTQAFKLLKADQSLLLPRIYCYFDDVLGFTYGDHNGERLAISEFNEYNNMRKISQIYGLRHFVPWQFANHWWVDCFYMAHILDHELYNSNDGFLNGITLELE